MPWHFLARGISGRHASQLVGDVISGLQGVRGSLDHDPEIAASQYLVWSESAELALISVYGGEAATRILHTDRYWRIREINLQTQRPHRLIDSEIDHQNRVLEGLRDELSRDRELLQGPETESLAVLDTNVLVHGQPFEAVRWDLLLKAKTVKILLPVVIVDELDKLKDGRQERARLPLITLDRLLAAGAVREPIALNHFTSLQIVVEPKDHQRAARNDDEIVRQAEYFQAVSQRSMTVVTRDRGMRVRSEIAGLKTHMLPPNLERGNSPRVGEPK